MNFSENRRSPARKIIGVAFVILLHVAIVYALISGLARKMVEVIAKPIETSIIEEIKPLPPAEVPPPPKLAAPPPPSFVPPPEIVVKNPAQQNDAISAVTNVQPASPDLPPAHVSSSNRVAAVVDARACQKPQYPSKSLRNEEEGVVTLEFLIGIDGRVVEAKIQSSSGYKDLDNAARAALSLCKFKPGTVDGKPEQSWTKMQYVWKME
jgi:protein TonB